MKGIYLVTDRQLSAPREIEEVVQQAVLGGVSAVQLREKNATTREFIADALKLRALLAPRGIPLLINDRVDIALAVGADGVHLGQSDLPYPLARKLLGPSALIGISVESLDQLREVEEWDLAYVALSPVLQTPTKQELTKAWGLDGIHEARRISRHALAAIGGVHAGNAGSMLDAGADVLAVVSAICSAESPHQAAAELRRIYDEHARTTA